MRGGTGTPLASVPAAGIATYGLLRRSLPLVDGLVSVPGISSSVDIIRDADAIPHIFERFYRVDPARSSTVEGAGLGLSLVKWIVDGHRGRIDVRSEPGKGSTFTIWLPVAHP